MKLLLDENMPHTLRSRLPGHDVYTVHYMRWTSFKNGVLLQMAADAGFDAMLTCDRAIPDQQNLARLPCSVVVIKASSLEDEEDLEDVLRNILHTLDRLQPRTLVLVP